MLYHDFWHSELDLTLKVDLLFKKIDQDYDFWIRGVTYMYCCYLHMVAAGELCCLSDNSGFFFFHLTKFTSLPVSYIDLKPEYMCQNQTFVQVKS